MSEAHRQDPETPPASPPFAAPDAGNDYFASEAHYLSLAGRIVAGLREDVSFVLVTGHPPPDPRLLAPALSRIAAGWYAVSVVACGPDSSREQLLRAVSPSPTPLFVFDGADALSDGQIEGICQPLANQDGNTPALAMLARPSFLTRLGALQPQLFKKELVTRFHLQELGREEIETFIRRQLRPGDVAAFTAEAVTAIADFSGGDPAVVNRLSRLMVEFSDSGASKAGKKPIEGAGEPAPAQSEIATETNSGVVDLGSFPTEPSVTPVVGEFTSREAPPPNAVAERPPPRGRRMAGRLLLGVLFCLGIAGLATMPGDLVFSLGHRALQRIAVSLGPWINPVRDHASASIPGNAAAPPEEGSPAEKGLLPTPSTAAETSEIVPVQRTVSDQVEPQWTAPAPNVAPMKAAESTLATPIPAVPPTTEQILAMPSANPRSSAAEMAALVARGDAFVAGRDIASARLFYERAAEMGDGRAALWMGATSDPAFLDRAGIRGTKGDWAEARTWYQRARDLGDAEADRLLKTLELN
jgi:hypothetical protein